MKTLFVEPCPGCFENSLRELSEVPGGAVFLGAGDFTLSRFLIGISRLMHGGEVLIATYRLEQSTIDTLERLKKERAICRATIIYEVTDVELKPYDGINIAYTPNRAFVVAMRHDRKYITITGMFSQEDASHSLECFTMINDLEQQQALFRFLLGKMRP